MDISERVLFSELAQLLKKGIKEKRKTSKLPQDPNQPPSEYFAAQEKSQMGLVKGGEVSIQKIDQLSILEKEIIRILLLFGNEEVGFVEEISTIEDDGKETLSYRKYQNLVS